MPCRPPITIKLLEPRHLRRYGDMWMEVEQNTAHTEFSPMRGPGGPTTPRLVSVGGLHVAHVRKQRHLGFEKVPSNYGADIMCRWGGWGIVMV